MTALALNNHKVEILNKVFPACVTVFAFDFPPGLWQRLTNFDVVKGKLLAQIF